MRAPADRPPSGHGLEHSDATAALEVLVLDHGARLWAGGDVSRAHRTWATDDSWAVLTSV